MSTISIDTESTGVDLYHSARPFYVVIGSNKGITSWEWSVDPLTRKPRIPKSDVIEIQEHVNGADTIIAHNMKFDFGMLKAIGIHVPWSKVHDTLIASHVLASNLPHNLTDLCLQYLYTDIEKYEDTLQEIVQQCRRDCRRDHHEWLIADKDLTLDGQEMMPSAKEKTWKYDLWLPKAISLTRNYPPMHTYQTCLAKYANIDAEVTLALWSGTSKFAGFETLLRKRDLWEIYLSQLKLASICQGMESYGLTYSGERVDTLSSQIHEMINESTNTCYKIADDLGVSLTLPSGPVNKSLTSFMFDTLKLQVVKKTKNHNPAMDKESMRIWSTTLDKDSPPHQFITALSNRRKARTALQYLEGYERFAVPLSREKQHHPSPANPNIFCNWHVLHPNINQTGTDTLRFSFNNPNSANMSKEGVDGSQEYSLRYAFGPLPGKEWWAFDYANIELRIPAYASGQKELIELFERSDEPPYYGSEHILNFSIMYRDIWEDAVRKVGPKEVAAYIKKEYKATYYQWCKNTDFGLQYNCGEHTCDTTARRKGTFKLLKSTFAKKEALNQKCIQHAEKYGYVETLPDRTVNPRRGYPLLCTRSENGGILNTVPLAYMVSGTAMWCTRKAMLRVDEQLSTWQREERFNARMVLQVHDEIVVEMPSILGNGKESPNVNKARKIRQLMELSGDDIGIPLKVEINLHTNNYAMGEKIV